MKYNLLILPRARDDAQECFRRLSRHSVQGAMTWNAVFEDAAEGLIVDAEIHAIVPSRGMRRDAIRSKPFHTRHGKTYQLIYVIISQEVRILRVWSPGQRPVRRRDLS